MRDQGMPVRRDFSIGALGVALCGCGMTADSTVGLAILRGASPWLLLLHPLAVVVWIEGLCTLDSRSIWEEAHAIVANMRRWCASTHTDPVHVANDACDWNARTAAMSLLALVLFPGFGSVGCTAAFSLAALPFLIRRRRPAPPIDAEGEDSSVFIDAPSNPLLDLAVQPLVDIVDASDSEQKRAAIRMLGKQFDHEAVHLLRGLLTDPNPDVRSEASVTLFRFEDLVTRAVNETATRVEDDPTAAHYAALALAYGRAVNLGLLDGDSARYYLSQARTAFEQAAALAPDQISHWVALAQLHHDLGDGDAALRSLDTAFALDASDVSANRLRMEIAFAERRWDIVAAVSSLTGDTAKTATVDTLLGWWSGATIGEGGTILHDVRIQRGEGDV